MIFALHLGPTPPRLGGRSLLGGGVLILLAVINVVVVRVVVIIASQEVGEELVRHQFTGRWLGPASDAYSGKGRHVDGGYRYVGDTYGALICRSSLPLLNRPNLDLGLSSLLLLDAPGGRRGQGTRSRRRGDTSSSGRSSNGLEITQEARNRSVHSRIVVATLVCPERSVGR